MQSYTVHSVVQELLQFLLCKASDYSSTALVEAFAAKVLHLLGECGSAALDSVASAAPAPAPASAGRATGTSPTPAPAGGGAVSTSVAGSKRPLKELTVAEVGELLVKCELASLVPVFAAKEVKGRRLANCEGYADLMDKSIGVDSAMVAKELWDLVEEWKMEGVAWT
jgi:hypothetical protein